MKQRCAECLFQMEGAAEEKTLMPNVPRLGKGAEGVWPLRQQAENKGMSLAGEAHTVEVMG